jgi:hypothetical protein
VISEADIERIACRHVSEMELHRASAQRESTPLGARLPRQARTPFALAVCVAMTSISGGERQS